MRQPKWQLARSIEGSKCMWVRNEPPHLTPMRDRAGKELGVGEMLSTNVRDPQAWNRYGFWGVDRAKVELQPIFRERVKIVDLENWMPVEA